MYTDSLKKSGSTLTILMIAVYIFRIAYSLSLLSPVRILLFVLTIGSAVQCESRRRMDRSVYFEKINANLSWTINSDTQSLLIELIAPISAPNAWMAFGLSDFGGMKGADIALISLYDHRIYDLHSEDFVMPIMDKVQNYELLYLEKMEDRVHTVAQFKRRLVACDEEDYSIKTDRTKHQLMIAYNDNDPFLSTTTNSKLNIIRHQYQQRKEVNLFFDEDLFLHQTAADESFYDFILKNHTILQSDGDTQYWFVFVETFISFVSENKMSYTKVYIY